jgi:hypothetical protein
MLANPVVRKAIHEVRRHIEAYRKRFNRLPDRIIIELARETRQSGKVRQAALDLNRQREKIRKTIRDKYNQDLVRLTPTQRKVAESAEGLNIIDRLAEAHGRKGAAGVTGRDLAGPDIVGQRTYWGRLPPDSPVLESNRLLARLVDLQRQEATKGDLYHRQIVGAVKSTAGPMLLVGRLP